MVKNNKSTVEKLISKSPYRDIMQIIIVSEGFYRIRFKHLRILLCLDEQHKKEEIKNLESIIITHGPNVFLSSDHKTYEYRLPKNNDEVEDGILTLLNYSEIKPIIKGKYQISNLNNFITKLVNLGLIKRKKDKSPDPYYVATDIALHFVLKSLLIRLIGTYIEEVDKLYDFKISKDHTEALGTMQTFFHACLMKNIHNKKLKVDGKTIIHPNGDVTFEEVEKI